MEILGFLRYITSRHPHKFVAIHPQPTPSAGVKALTPTLWFLAAMRKSVGEKSMGKLSAIGVRTALANPGTYQDGDGLFLKVDKRGGAHWNLRVQQDGKRRDIGIGSAKLVTLAAAREKANELRMAVKVEKRDVLAERKDEAAAKVTFREAALLYHAENAAGWKSEVYTRQWLASLQNYVFPKLGNKPTGSVTTADIISVLTPIWQETPETARQVRNRIHVHGFRSAFTDWAANEGHPNAVVEAALAHKTPDEVQAAYRRTTYLGTKEKPGMRVRLMDASGAYCSGMPTTPPAPHAEE
jgi:hypothetical protein